MGKAASLSSLRDQVTELEDDTPLIATIHPSYLLRIPEEARREKETARFMADLQRAKVILSGLRNHN